MIFIVFFTTNVRAHSYDPYTRDDCKFWFCPRDCQPPRDEVCGFRPQAGSRLGSQSSLQYTFVSILLALYGSVYPSSIPTVYWRTTHPDYQPSLDTASALARPVVGISRNRRLSGCKNRFRFSIPLSSGALTSPKMITSCYLTF